MKLPCTLHSTCLLLALLCSQPLAAATTAIPLPEGHQSIAEWGGNRTFWSNPGPDGAPIAGVLNARSATPGATSGTFLLASTVNTGATYLPGFLKPGRNTSTTISTSNLTLEVPDLLTFQMVSVYAPTTLNLTIGSTVYSIAQATLTTDNTIATAGDNQERYEGLYASLLPTLYTYTWDLNALGFTGESLAGLAVTFARTGTNWDTYEVQLSVGSAVPEPSMTLLALLGLSATVMRRRRPRIAESSS